MRRKNVYIQFSFAEKPGRDDSGRLIKNDGDLISKVDNMELSI